MASPLNFYPLPLGTVIAHAGLLGHEQRAALADAGWLPCEGQAIARSAYPDLFEAMGTAHGAGDGSSSFNLPDYRGRFLRGVNAGAGRDPDAAARQAAAAGGHAGDAVGSVQGDCLRSHDHAVQEMVHDDQVDGVDSATTHSFEHRNQPRRTGAEGGAETRPVNAAVHWLVLAGIPNPST